MSIYQNEESTNLNSNGKSFLLQNLKEKDTLETDMEKKVQQNETQTGMIFPILFFLELDG